jgi:exodeoxyribonuclease VII small subunit
MTERAGGASDSLESLAFEDALERLEALVGRLEQGDLRLEDALAAFEEGVSLARRCADGLDAADRRIEELVRRGGEWLKRPLDGGEDTA